MSENSLKTHEKSLENNSDVLIELLKESSNWASNHIKDSQTAKFVEKVIHEKLVTAQRIKTSASRPIALGVFGASQCGKSYLVSELVRGTKKSPLVFLNAKNEKPQQHDYIEEINPPGGRESTAIVTRFTVRPYKQISGCSAFVRLLDIADLVKIFLNGFLFECRSDFMPDAKELQKLRYSFRSFTGKPHDNHLLNENDVLKLQDYARRHFHNQFLRMLDDLNYWSILKDEIINLPADQQITYLEWLWGKYSAITTLFKELYKPLKQLGGQVVGIFNESLLPRQNSIIDVQRLSDLMQPGNRKYTIVTQTGQHESIDAAVLCALTSELILQVDSPGQNTVPEKLDILDFPGARARAQIYDEIRLTKDKEALVEVFLRGKVACLFDNFSDDRDISALLLCQEGGPQEAKSLPYMINKWVEWSQGKTAEDRKNKKCLLFHAFTKFDMDLVTKRGEDPKIRWDSRLKTNFRDFFSRAGDWVNDWDGQSAFNNCFWFRNPSVAQTVFGRDKDGKEFVRDEQQLEQIKNDYLSNANVKKHFKEPLTSWNMAATPEESGVSHLTTEILQNVAPFTKINQLKNNILQIHSDLTKTLEPYYIGEDITKARNLAMQRAKQCITQLGRQMPVKYSLPIILDNDRFSISDETIAMIFDSVVNPMSDEQDSEEQAEAQNQAPVFEESIFMFDDQPEKEEQKETKVKIVSKGQIFADAVLDRWQAQLAQTGQDEEFQNITGLDADWFTQVSQELIKAASRIQLESEIVNESDTYLNAPAANRFMRKTAVKVASMINNFVLQLNKNRTPPAPPSGPPKVFLSARAYPGLEIYKHWITALTDLFKDNVAQASEDDEESNRILESILNTKISL